MERLCGNYLVAAAVYCLLVTLTSAVRVSSINCTSGGNECPTHSACVTSGNTPLKCKCNAAYKEGAAPNDNTCVPKAVGDSCTQHTDCSTGDTNSECSTGEPKKCVCKTGYTPINNVCKRGLGDPCTTDGECTAGVTDSKCSTAEQRKCECNTDFTAIDNMCKRGLGNTCTDGASCSAVSNAECPDATKKCTCKANYKEDNGQCSKAIGLQTLLSAPVALLLSFLTIVVTRLH